MSTTVRNLRIGVVGIPAGWSSERMADAVQARTGRRELVHLRRVVLDLHGGQALHAGQDLAEFDALIVKKLGSTYHPEMLDRLEILHFLAERGVSVFSKPAAMMRLLDRLSCTVTLRLGAIPLPETTITEEIDEATAAVQRYGKAVLKPLFTSKGRGMAVASAGPEARAQVEAFRSAGNTMLYVQRMVPLPGRDLGVVFLGGEYLACYARVAHHASWSTCTSAGGKYQPYAPSQEVIDTACRAQALFGLDFTCVDVGLTPDGPVVFEVSAFGGFRGLLEACGLDAAERYVDYVLSRLGHGHTNLAAK